MITKNMTEIPDTVLAKGYRTLDLTVKALVKGVPPPKVFADLIRVVGKYPGASECEHIKAALWLARQ